MKNRYGLFIAVGLVIGLSLLTVGIQYLNSPSHTDPVTYNLPDSSPSSPSQPQEFRYASYWDGRDDGYHGYSASPPSIPSYLEYGSFEYGVSERRQEDYWKGYVDGQNERIEDIESQLDE